ncbi:MAG: ABC transporter permease [Clostridiales bacterium]|jgi:NitT/TauT family transport system permease protein|nr:ABC transporter permease [Clostridiales bacterium]MDR2749276.1 ABC transporter permease [Clostridiales bacterium]
MKAFIKAATKRVLKTLYGWLAIICFFALWEILSRLEVLINPLFFPPVSKIFATLWKIIVGGALWKHLFISLQRALLGFLAGLVFAIPVGLAIGWFRRLESFLSPLLQVFRNTPTLALLPVFIMLFGITELSKVVIIFWGSFWGLLLNSISGVQNVDPSLIRASRSMGTSSPRLFLTVILPASLPSILTGLRLSATASVLIVIAAEMIGANKGLGYQLTFYQANYKFAEMYAYIFIMSIIGITLNSVLTRVEKNSFRWRDNANAMVK